MSGTNEQAKPKRKRVSRADAKAFTRACRRTLKQKPEGSDDPWGEILSVTLYEVAVHPESSLSLRLQAIKTAIALCGDQPIDLAKVKHEEPESKSSKSWLQPTAEEEALSDEDLDAQIAELEGRLGSIPAIS
ncbi:MAG TPA: hypothetical protein VNX88_07670 [Terriglobales bacterium]|jgi:hypothetical protein|nr:hypothetical protein [Terriglobales bacterium]